jgi:hypothetical protein
MFERGFKSWCEKHAIETRKLHGLKQHERLDPYEVARRLNVTVWTEKDVPGLSAASLSLLNGSPGASTWSAVTLVHGERRLVILNSSHSPGRLSNDLMHELAHIILKHSPSAMEISEHGVALRKNYDKQQEQEADWLAACLLLPRPALVNIKRLRKDIAAAAQEYGVSPAMLNYRLAVTGVNAQFA